MDIFAENSNFRKNLTEALRNHRKKLGLTQAKAAELLCISENTYQRWETKGLDNICDILNLFKILKFSSVEIIKLLGLTPIKLSDIKDIVADEKTLKSIKENGIYTYIRDNCENMADITIDKLIYTLFTVYLKRKYSS